jgi:hypothetical protein
MLVHINQYEKFDNDSDNEGFFGDELDENLGPCVSQRDNHNECDNINKINSNEITYLINHQRSTILLLRVVEPEELLFDDNDELDVLKALNIRELHNAFSRADRLCGIQICSTVNLDEGSQNRIERNTANELVRSLQENDSYVEN